ncbi:hypothetical protein ABKV19_004087 [Rosa sericea]
MKTVFRLPLSDLASFSQNKNDEDMASFFYLIRQGATTGLHLISSNNRAAISSTTGYVYGHVLGFDHILKAVKHIGGFLSLSRSVSLRGAMGRALPRLGCSIWPCTEMKITEKRREAGERIWLPEPAARLETRYGISHLLFYV